MKCKSLASVVTLSCALMLAFAGTVEVSTASTSAGVSGTAEKAVRHCITGPGKATECFDTEAEALFKASGGRIQLAPGQTSASLSDDELFGPEASIYATLYEHANYGGSSLTIWADGCYGWNNMPSGWSDVVSSARTASCGITLYEHYNLSGAYLYIASPGTSYVGNAWNDRASSWSLP